MQINWETEHRLSQKIIELSNSAKWKTMQEEQRNNKQHLE